MASLCRMCGGKAEPSVSLLDTSQHHLQWAINHFHIKLDDGLPTTVCLPCVNDIRDWTSVLNRSGNATSWFSTVIANQCAQLDINSSVPGTERLQVPRQLTSRPHTSNTSVPSKPSTSVHSTTQFSTATNSSSASVSDLSLPQHLVTKYHIRDLTITVSRLSGPVLNTLQQHGTVDANTVAGDHYETSRDNLNQGDDREAASVQDQVNKDVDKQLTRRVKCNPGSQHDEQIRKEKNPVFSCANCEFSTNCKSNIISHVVSHHGKMSSYQCQECSKSFKLKRDLHTHISHVHPNKCSYKCLLCKRGFKLEKYFNAHIKNHGKILQCDNVCGKIFSSKREHKMTIHTKSSPLSCHMCSKIFYTEANLKLHTRAVRSQLSYKCDICDKSFTLKSNLCRHQRGVHASVRAFSCNQCEKTFVSKSALKQHSVVHSDLRPFKCEKCGSCFNQSGHLTCHIRTVHSNVRAFKCHLCGKSFKTKGEVTNHLIRHSDVRNYKCEQCGKQFKTNGDLKDHLTSHSEIRPFACAQCHKKFKSKSNLVGHLRQVHSDLRPFSCDKCPFACKSNSDLIRHQVVHSNVRKFECYHCKSKFKYRSVLSAHIKTKHSNLH